MKQRRKISIPHATFYRWYDLYQTGEPDALNDDDIPSRLRLGPSDYRRVRVPLSQVAFEEITRQRISAKVTRCPSSSAS
jgi:hypothetical protein